MREFKVPDCECGGCNWTDAIDADDREEYVVVGTGRPYLPWEADVEHCVGRAFAQHRRNMCAKAGSTPREFWIYRLVRVE